MTSHEVPSDELSDAKRVSSELRKAALSILFRWKSDNAYSLNTLINDLDAAIKADRERHPAGDEPEGGYAFAIVFDDADRRHEIVFTEAAARERFRQISASWNAHLFVKVESNSRDDKHANRNIPWPPYASPRPAGGGEAVAWRAHAAQWLRRKAETTQPAAEVTGWANPAHSLPDRLYRLADELDSEQEAAPFGLEPWEVPVVNKFGDTLKPEVQKFFRGMHDHLLRNAAPAPKVLPSEASEPMDGGFHEAYAEGFDAGKAQVSQEVSNLVKFLDDRGAPTDCEDGWAPEPFSLRGRVEVLLLRAALRQGERPTDPAVGVDEGVRRDAGRYRWLRAEHERHDPICHLSWKRNGDRSSGEWVNTSRLDTTVDLAIDAELSSAAVPGAVL